MAYIVLRNALLAKYPPLVDRIVRKPKAKP